MTVYIRNPKGDIIDTVDCVNSVTTCDDGRFLLHHTKNCAHCGCGTDYVFQVPVGYLIEGSGKKIVEVD